MRKYYRQAEAIDARTPGESLFQNQTNGQRYYVSCTNRAYWDTFLANGDRYGYEMIVRDEPCHLYIDLDVDREKYPNIKVENIWLILEQELEEVFELLNIDCKIIEKRLHFATSDKKGSMHVIFNIPGFIFKNNAHVGAFMRCVREKTSKTKHSMIFDEKFVDMSVYSQYRLFRMLGCTKWGDTRPFSNGKELTFENWVSNKVQPEQTDAVFFDVKEPDNSEPVYSGSIGGSSGWRERDLKFITEFISQKHNRVSRLHAYPLKGIIACNMTARWCPFKNALHKSSERLYALIRLDHVRKNHYYQIKCHSEKCKMICGKNPQIYYFDEHIENAIEQFLDEKIMLQSCE